MTPQERLAAIKTLCDDTILHDHDGFGVVYASRIRDVLADVDPEPTEDSDDPVMPRETLHERMAADKRLWKIATENQPAPASSTIDRDALVKSLREARGCYWEGRDPEADLREAASHILALVQPAQDDITERLGRAAYAAYVATGEDTDGARNWRELFLPLVSPPWEDVLRTAVEEVVKERDEAGQGITLTAEEASLASHALSKIRVDETRVHYTKYLALAKRLGGDA